MIRFFGLGPIFDSRIIDAVIWHQPAPPPVDVVGGWCDYVFRTLSIKPNQRNSIDPFCTCFIGIPRVYRCPILPSCAYRNNFWCDLESWLFTDTRICAHRHSEWDHRSTPESKTSNTYTIDYRIYQNVVNPDTLEHNCLYTVASRVFIDELIDSDKITDWELRLLHPNYHRQLFDVRARVASDVARQMDFRGMCDQCFNRRLKSLRGTHIFILT